MCAYAFFVCCLIGLPVVCVRLTVTVTVPVVYRFVLRACLFYGFVFNMGLFYGFVLWVCFMGLLYGFYGFVVGLFYALVCIFAKRLVGVLM